MISSHRLGSSRLDFAAMLELLQASRDFPCHVNLQPAPYQCSLAEDTNSALFVLLDRLSKKEGRRVRGGVGVGSEDWKRKLENLVCM